MRPVDLETKFWNRVLIGNDCWTWTGAVHDKDGYGYVARQINGTRKQILSHRQSWEYTNGPVPDGMYICHHCDNPSCVRPEHLFLGTHADNQKDKMRKGRHRVKKTDTSEGSCAPLR